MSIAVVITPWLTLEDGSVALLLGQAQPLPLWCKLEDITGTPQVPCEPNLCVAQFSSLPKADPEQVQAWIDAVQGDRRFMLLWTE